MNSFDFAPIAYYTGILTYLALAGIALWGAYCVFFLMRRISQLRFDTEAEQEAFLDMAEALAKSGKFDELDETCEGDPRAVVQLAKLAINKRKLSKEKIRDLLLQRYERDVASELEYRNTWIQTVIKTAPMLGLFGTVIGMMGAFSKLSSQTQVSADKLASDIMLALITTACGLAIAIPLVLAMASVIVRITQLEEYVYSAINRLTEKT